MPQPHAFALSAAGLPQVGLKLKLLNPLLAQHPPKPATEWSAGLDLRACIEEERLEIAPGQRAKIPTGLAMETEAPGVAGLVCSRSGLGAKEGLTVAQGVGLIDPDYRGEIIVWLLNTSEAPLSVERGQRIAQLVLIPVLHPVVRICAELEKTERGAGGFGHTGKS
jgi:dUTP pyrophosphatase